LGAAEAAAAIEKVIATTLRHGKIAGVGGDRHLPRQMDYIRRGARFITTNSEIAFIMAEASRVTGELRQALQSGVPG
jgi:2-keto-3-deoxy-L-rhamnonate aldolase RhmA